MSSHGRHRTSHRRAKRTGAVPRLRMALVAGVVVTSVSAGAGIAFDLPDIPGLAEEDSDPTTQAAAGTTPSAEPKSFEVTPVPDSPSPSASRSAAVQARGEKLKVPAPRPTPEKPSRSAGEDRPKAAPTTEVPAPTRPPQPQQPPPSAGNPDTSVTERVVALANEERAKAGCPALKINDRLTRAAEKYSDVMASSGELSHTGPDGSTMSSRVDAEGYAWSALGENIAQGYQTPESVMEGWMDSEGHRANLLNCDFTEIGVGVNTGSGGPWWTQDFGTGR